MKYQHVLDQVSAHIGTKIAKFKRSSWTITNMKNNQGSWRNFAECLRLERCRCLRDFHRFPSFAEISSFESVQFSLEQTEQGAFCTFFISFFQAPLRRFGLRVSSPVQCFSSGCRSEGVLFVVSRLDSKGENVNDMQRGARRQCEVEKCKRDVRGQFGTNLLFRILFCQFSWTGFQFIFASALDNFMPRGVTEVRISRVDFSGVSSNNLLFPPSFFWGVFFGVSLFTSFG